jgi:hypothetical protein
MHPGRYLGIVMGLVILAGVFALPFGSAPGAGTLYGVAAPVLGDLGGLQASGNAQLVTFGYLLVISFILLVVAGVVGIFPLGTGVLGVVGMALLSVAPGMIYPNAGSILPSGGAGFYLLWAASVIALGASFWHRRERKPAPSAAQEPS